MSEARPLKMNPAPIMELISGYQRSEAIRGAFELDLFTAISAGATSASEISRKIEASERGTRILCDYLAAEGILHKEENNYRIPQELEPFLNSKSSLFLGAVVNFIQHPELKKGFSNVADIVRKGGTLISDQGTLSPEHPVWVEFARSMAGALRAQALMLAPLIPFSTDQKLKILDVAAGHGMFGIEVLKIYQNAEVTALDWPNVLEIAKKNAREAEVSGRYKTLAGDAFEVELPEKYDLILLANFLHHFSSEACVKLLKRFRSAVTETGKCITLEFVPNPDRVSPKGSAQFSFIMLCSTPEGDAYTFEEYGEMFQKAGFINNSLHKLAPGMEEVIISGI